MSSYNSYDGVPMVANSHVLTDILRTEWNYQNYVMSDAGGTSRLSEAFFICGVKDNDCITLQVSAPHRGFFLHFHVWTLLTFHGLIGSARWQRRRDGWWLL